MLLIVLIMFHCSCLEAQSSDIDKMELLFDCYEKNMVKAINNNDFSLVEKYLLKDSPLYNSQKQLITNLYQRGIKEDLVSYQIIDSSFDYHNEKKFTVYVHEIFSIFYPEKQKSEFKEFDYIYILSIAEKDYGLFDIQRWERTIKDSYLPKLKKGYKLIYSNGEIREVKYPIHGISFLHGLKNKNKWNGIRLYADRNSNYSDIIYVETEAGLYIQGLQSNMYLELKYPVRLNEEWTDTFGSAGAGSASQSLSIHYKVISVSEILETPLKTFKDVVVVKSDKGIKYFTKDYGLIKEDKAVISKIIEK